jgi:glutamine amidotransferase
VDFALKRLGINALLTDDLEIIKSADKVIFPGVGEAGTTMSFLKERKLDVLIKNLKQPVLGICLGLQLMCSYSEEGQTECLGIFDEVVTRFKSVKKVPHMGWNQIQQLRGGIFDPGLEKEYMYFVHSYYAPVGPDTTAITDYICHFSSALEKNNYFATQFHPEKSGKSGEKILKNFIKL